MTSDSDLSSDSAISQDFKKSTGIFESFDGTPIYYEVRGDGPPLVLCYGIACGMNHWIHQLKYFSRKYRTIVFDYRGHHRTPIPQDPENMTIDAICKDMSGLLEHLGAKRASYWGHSYGAMLLLRYYDLFPESVGNLVFINGFATNPLNAAFGGRGATGLFHLVRASHEKYPWFVKRAWRTLIDHPVAVTVSSLVGGFNLHLSSLKDIEIYARGVAHLNLDGLIPLFGQMLDYDGSNVLEHITVPSLIITGTKDSVTPLSYQEKMHRKIRGSQYLRVPYGSHCTQLDLPDFVNLRIEKFLRDSGYGATP